MKKKLNTLVRDEKDMNVKTTIIIWSMNSANTKNYKTTKEHFSIGGSETTIQSTVSEATNIEQQFVRQCLVPPAIKF